MEYLSRLAIVIQYLPSLGMRRDLKPIEID